MQMDDCKYTTAAMKLPVFPPSATTQERVKAAGAEIRRWCRDFQTGIIIDGVETFQDHLIKQITEAGLGEMRDICPSRVIVHPDNREGALLIPVDAQDLLLQMVCNGFLTSRVDCLACEMPPVCHQMREEWLTTNRKVIDLAGGLLAPIVNPDLIEAATARGSHTTAAVRCFHYEVKTIHTQLCQQNNNTISKSHVLERQPSMGQPLQLGLPYFVIRFPLAEACPMLVDMLSRTGNVVHGTYREATVLQACNRIHGVIITMAEGAADDVLIEAASRGLPPSFKKTATTLLPFVKTWSGGGEGQILHDMERYEQGMSVKRKLAVPDIAQFSKVDALGLEMYVPGMIKAMLNSPSEFSDTKEHSTLFAVPSADVASIGPSGRNRGCAIEANEWMVNFGNYLDAYGRITEGDRARLVSDFQVTLVMHVHQKKSDTRKSYNSLIAIAHAHWTQAKARDDRLPAWGKLSSFEPDKQKGTKANAVGLREVRPDGQITNAELERRGFKVGLKVRLTDDEADDDSIFTFASFGDDQWAVQLQRKADDNDDMEEDEECVRVIRSKLVAKYGIYNATAMKVIHYIVKQNRGVG